MSSLRVFAARPLVIAALHLPDFGKMRDKSMAWLEDYVAINARVFAEAGVPYIKLQDQSREAGPMQPISLAMTAASSTRPRSKPAAWRSAINARRTVPVSLALLTWNVSGGRDIGNPI